MNAKEIEKNRQIRQGNIAKKDDLQWEGYLQIHELAETLGLLDHDSKLHDYLNTKLAFFEEKYA